MKKTLNLFLNELQHQPKQDKIVVPLGSFMSKVFTATVQNDTTELAKLALESLEHKIQNYKNKAYYMGIDYDFMYMLSSTFYLRTTFDTDVCWGITTEYGHESEYDESYTATQLRWSDNKWYLETFHSDGGYSYSKINSKELTMPDVFNLIVNDGK